jgi:hypothetical protein
MQNKSQLPPELEKQFDEEFKHDFRDGGSSSCYGGKDCDCWVKDAKQFLATALEEQRLRYIKQVEKLPVSKLSIYQIIDVRDVLSILNGETL